MINYCLFKVIIISIVGAFRTGKSFLLTNFLKFLNSNQNSDWYENDNNNISFNWAYGCQAFTKGMWMWSVPIRCTLNSSKQEVYFYFIICLKRNFLS